MTHGPAAAQGEEVVQGLQRLRLRHVLPHVEYADGAVVVRTRNLLLSIEDTGHCELHVALPTAEEHVAEQYVGQRGSLARG